MATNNVTHGGNQTETLHRFLFSASLTSDVREPVIFLSALNIFLSITAFLGNTLILFALRKESSLHQPSKLLLRCLATTDLCVGLISQPLTVTYWLSLVQGDWDFCFAALSVTYVASYILCSVTLLTLAAISMDSCDNSRF